MLQSIVFKESAWCNNVHYLEKVPHISDGIVKKIYKSLHIFFPLHSCCVHITHKIPLKYPNVTKCGNFKYYFGKGTIYLQHLWLTLTCIHLSTENGQKSRRCRHAWWIHLFLSRGRVHLSKYLNWETHTVFEIIISKNIKTLSLWL